MIQTVLAISNSFAVASASPIALWRPIIGMLEFLHKDYRGCRTCDRE